MLIDWFTVAAQALNFLILVWLLRRFLYRPILDAIDAREKRVARQLADAQAKMVEAEKERDDFLAKNADFDRQKSALLEEAAEAAKAEAQKILEEAHRAADTLSAQRRQALMGETRNAIRLVRERAIDEVFAITRKTLRDLADVSLDRRMTEAFLWRLENLQDSERSAIAEAISSSSGPLIIRSAFELPSDQRSAIETAVKKNLSENGVRFETAPALVAGIELVTSGHKVSWSISDYLASMEEDLGELLSQKGTPDSENG